MKNSTIRFKATTPRCKNLRRGLFRIPLVLVLAGLALAPAARALRPPPDGGYPNETTAEGDGALFSLTSGFGNTAPGFNALNSDTEGSFNTANGWEALVSNTTGSGNTANGVDALYSNTTGNNNVALGNSAGGFLTTGDNNIVIFNDGVAGESNHIRIGSVGTHTSTFIAGI